MSIDSVNRFAAIAGNAHWLPFGCSISELGLLACSRSSPPAAGPKRTSPWAGGAELSCREFVWVSCTIRVLFNELARVFRGKDMFALRTDALQVNDVVL